jgi:predicted PurR-regulated permease PerM
MNQQSSENPKLQSRRASDTYVPISLLISGVGTIAALVAIVSPILNNTSALENRLTKIETRLERLQELNEQIKLLESRCRPKS